MEYEIGQYVNVDLPNELKATGKMGKPYYSGIGELVDIQLWKDRITHYCVTFPSKGSVWFRKAQLQLGKYRGMTHTLKYQWAKLETRP